MRRPALLGLLCADRHAGEIKVFSVTYRNPDTSQSYTFILHLRFYVP